MPMQSGLYAAHAKIYATETGSSSVTIFVQKMSEHLFSAQYREYYYNTFMTVETFTYECTVHVLQRIVNVDEGYVSQWWWYGLGIYLTKNVP